MDYTIEMISRRMSDRLKTYKGTAPTLKFSETADSNGFAYLVIQCCGHLVGRIALDRDPKDSEKTVLGKAGLDLLAKVQSSFAALVKETAAKKSAKAAEAAKEPAGKP